MELFESEKKYKRNSNGLYYIEVDGKEHLFHPLLENTILKRNRKSLEMRDDLIMNLVNNTDLNHNGIETLLRIGRRDRQPNFY